MKRFLLVAVATFCAICVTGCDSEIDDLKYAYPDSKDTVVTLEEYNKLETGMTEQEVWDVIGGKCTNTGTTDIGMGDEYVTVSYGCNGEGSFGANVILMFQGGKLSTKTQAGLE